MCFKINIILLHISKVSSQTGFLFIFLEDCVLFGLNIHIIKPKYELNFHFFYVIYRYSFWPMIMYK